jgi:hypothetical protein
MTEQAQTGTPKPPASPSPAEAVDQLRGLFDTLVPAATVTISDGFGGQHVVRGVLVARAQVLVMRHLETLAEAKIPESARRSALAGGLGDVAGLVIRLASDPEVLRALSEAFAVAHPAAVRAAEQNARALGIDLPATPDPSDLFPIEEIVAGLAPFALRLAKRALDTVAQVTANPAATSR